MTRLKFPDEVKYFTLLDEKVLKVPTRSRFYHLQPLGVGTPRSECLTSYICRLAAAHNVSVGNLFEFALVPELNKSYLKAPERLGPAAKLNSSFRNQIKNINSTGKIARDWIDILEKLTLRKDLSNLTLIKMSKILSRYYITRTFQAWCPICLNEMKNSNAEIYYPLLWSLMDVKVCHFHRIPLFEICNKCSQKSLPLLKKVKLGFCSRCRSWLGDSQAKIPELLAQMTDKELKWNLFVAEEVSILISLISNSTITLPEIPISQTIKLCVEKTTDGIASFSRLIETHLATFYGWYTGKQKPHLRDILKIFYCLNITLTDFLTQSLLFTTREIIIRKWLGIDKRSPRPVPKTINKKRIKLQLEKYINIFPPLSMAQVSRNIGYDRTFLGHAFPEIKEIIKLRHSEYQKRVNENRRSILTKEVLLAIQKIEEKGEFVSTKRLAKFLNKPTYEFRRDVAQTVFANRKIGKS